MAVKDGTMRVPYSKRSKNMDNEDCLFLNVYTPLKKMLPVMVYIHEGAYLYGSSSSLEFGPEYLLDSDVVLVTMDCRLGLLGFLSTGNGEAPGNFGLKDQVLALLWVQENIPNFGGNPQKVTLFGLSSQSNCVHFHTLSDASNGLFHQYIMQGGDAISYRSFQERREYSKFSKAVGERFGCPFNNSRLLVNYLRNDKATRLYDSISVFNKTWQLLEMMCTPTNEPNIDGVFITDTPFNLLRGKSRKDYPFINGMTKDEELYF
ncbi:esterase FE4-like [Belonocnema kinseyi]|uniref:esterase FE4-like n=1 Tax=Belonocnema kinseyi TaxID=2817044 RepID=UPI00143D3D2E|nr:esterase FE4-like [Belonocnema kinseyi]